MEHRIFTNEDLPLLPLLQPEGWPDIVPHFEYYLQHPFCFPFKIILENQMTGLGCMIQHEEVAWLAHIIVHHDYRNKGIGNKITKLLIDLAFTKKCTTICLIATDLGKPVYDQLGFKTEGKYLFYKDVASTPHPEENKHIQKYTDHFESSLLSLDKIASGENRKTELLLHLEGGYVYTKNNQLEGYYLPSWREGPIIATTPMAGKELMKLRFLTNTTAVVPEENQDAIEFLTTRQHVPFKALTRMHLGASLDWKVKYLYNRIAGNIG